MHGRIYLHVGTHKTGTTSLQDSLANQRDQLEALGVIYPILEPFFRAGASGHHAVAHALASYDLRNRTRLWFLRYSIGWQLRGKRFGILSAEAMYRHTVDLKNEENVDDWFEAHKRYLERVARFLRGFEVHPVIYFRRPEDFIVSLYKEGVAIRNAALHSSLEEFVEMRLPRLHYERHIEMLRDVFGRVCVRSYEVAREKGILVDFGEALGLTSEEMLPLDQGTSKTRSSIGNKALRWLQEAEKAAGPSTHGRRLQFALRHGNCAPFAESRPSMLWKSFESRREFLLRFQHPGEYDTENETDLTSVNWTDSEHKDANASFSAWEEENLALLLKREKMNLKFYRPDPV